VVLTGVNLSAWGLKNTNQIWESRFAELLQYLLDNSSIARLRISSLWPEFIDDAVLKVFENERIYPHFHYSIQSGSRMKRLGEIWDEIRADFIESQTWKTLKVLVERVSSTGFKWWTQNYIEVTEKNFEVQSGEIKRNEIITGTLK